MMGMVVTLLIRRRLFVGILSYRRLRWMRMGVKREDVPDSLSGT